MFRLTALFHKQGFPWKTIFLLALILMGCNSTKYVQDGDYLLNSVEIHNSTKDVSKEELKSYLRQKENVKILGFWRFHLGLYNLSGQKNTGLNRWLKKVGEEPVIYDEILRQKSGEQLTLFLKNKGYFNAIVLDTVFLNVHKKAKVKFTIQANTRYTLNKVDYQINDESLRPLVFADTVRSLVKKGKPFDSSLHDKERERITQNIRNKGYFNFSKEYIYFLADSSLGNYKVNDSLVLMKEKFTTALGVDTFINHQKSKIKDVYFLVGFDPQKALQSDKSYFNSFDTLQYQGCYLLYGENINFRADVLMNSNYIFPGDFYSAELVERTQGLLSELQLFRFVNIRFKPLDNEVDEDGNQLLQCFIQLSTTKVQSYSFDIEGTNSSGNLGVAGSFSYKHKNLLKGAEVFDLRLRTASETQTTRDNSEQFNTLEVGVDASLLFPKFLMPIEIESFRKKYNPRTSVSTAFNYQRRPDYTRTLANSRLGYNWKSSRYVSHVFSPLDFSLVNIPYINNVFGKQIENTYLKYSYQDHLISSISYSYVYNQQELARVEPFWFFRVTTETAGNLMNSLVSMWEQPNQEGFREIFGIRYAQYFKSDIELRYHHSINKINSFAYRFFVGAGYPYGNFPVLPFEKRYFSGGANSLRGWPVRGVGPGNYTNANPATNYYNQTSDMRLEVNAEYRFKLFWMLEGALFVDAGNIWAIRPSGNEQLDKDGMFHLDEFYNQIAVNYGTGARLDFKYFILRLDMGVKAHDPSLPVSEKWILGNSSFKWDDTAFNFAIGYPF